MPWKGVTVSEQRQRFIEDYLLNFYSKTELAERFGVSRKTAHTHPGHQGKWIERYKEHGRSGLQEQSRRPHSCPWQTDEAIVDELVKLKQKHPSWGPAKLLDIMYYRDPGRLLPAVSTAARILQRAGLVKPRRRYRRVLQSRKISERIFRKYLSLLLLEVTVPTFSSELDRPHIR